MGGAGFPKRQDVTREFHAALLAMILLEFACRVCAKYPTSKKLDDFAKALEKADKRYFTQLPGPCWNPDEFLLPGPNPQSSPLGMMFDLIRNGKAHQYQSAIAKLLSSGEVDLALTGAEPGRELINTGRPLDEHLGYKLSGDLVLRIRTDQLFLDIKQALTESGLISSTKKVDDIVRPLSKPSARAWLSSSVVAAQSKRASRYCFTVSELVKALKAGGHKPL